MKISRKAHPLNQIPGYNLHLNHMGETNHPLHLKETHHFNLRKDNLQPNHLGKHLLFLWIHLTKGTFLFMILQLPGLQGRHHVRGPIQGRQYLVSPFIKGYGQDVVLRNI